MASREKSDKPLTKYQQTYNVQGPREEWCGQRHIGIAEAIIHAEVNLGMRGVILEAYKGTMRFTESWVVGWKIGSKRYRLDHSPTFVEENRAAASWAKTKDLKGTLGVHINEENFEGAKQKRVCHSTEASLAMAITFWEKWTKQF